MGLNRHDAVAGLLLVALGIVILYGAFGYGFGSIRNIGPGLFPAIIASFTIIFGVLITGNAFWNQLPQLAIEWRPMLATTAGIVIFALLVVPFGTVPAIFGLVVASSLADPKSKIVHMLLVAAFMSLAIWLIFRVGIGLSMPAFKAEF